MTLGTPATKAHHKALGVHFRVSYKDHKTGIVRST